MSKQIRISVSDEAYKVLSAESLKRDVTQGEIISAAILRMLQPEEKQDGGLEVFGAQMRFMQLMLVRLLEHAGMSQASIEALLYLETAEATAAPEKSSETNGSQPPIMTEEQMYGPVPMPVSTWGNTTDEPVPKDFLQLQPLRKGWRRVFYKDVE